MCNTDTKLDFTMTLWLQHTLYHVILADHECSEFVDPYLNTCGHLVTNHEIILHCAADGGSSTYTIMHSRLISEA